MKALMRTTGKLTWVELKLFAREPFGLIFTFAFPVVLLLVLVSVFGEEPSSAYGMPPADYYASSYVAVVIAAIGLLAVPVHIATYREGGILRRFRASSVPPVAIFGAQLAVGLLIAAIGATALVTIGRIVHGIALPALIGPTVAMFALGTLAFVAIGLLIAALAPGVRAAQAIGLLLFVPMWVLGGPGPPRSELSGFMQQVHDVMPLTFLVRSLQAPWVGRAADPRPSPGSSCFPQWRHCSSFGPDRRSGPEVVRRGADRDAFGQSAMRAQRRRAGTSSPVRGGSRRSDRVLDPRRGTAEGGCPTPSVRTR